MPVSLRPPAAPKQTLPTGCRLPANRMADLFGVLTSRRTPPKRDGIQYVIGFRVWCFFLRHYEVAGLNVQPNRWDGRRRVDHVNDSSYSCIPRVYEHVDEHADSRAVRAWAGGLALLFVVASNRFRLACFSCAPTWEGSWRP